MLPGRLISVLTIALCLNSASSLPAESGAYRLEQPRLLWDGENLAISNYFSDRLDYWNPVSRTCKSILTPPRSFGATIWNGNITLLKAVGKSLVCSRKAFDGEWRDYPVALDDQQSRGGLRGFPLTLNESRTPTRFFSMNQDLGFNQDGELSICSWWKLGTKGMLEPEALIPIELDSPLFFGEGPLRWLPMVKLRPRFAGLAPFLEYPVRTRDAFLVVSLHAGILWVIPDDAPVPKRVIRLMHLDEDRLSGKVSYPEVIIALQPMVNGHVLVAMRSEKAVRDAARDHPEPKPEALTTKKEGSDGAAPRTPISHPEIIWKEIDPVVGTVEDPDPALLGGAPTELDPDHPFSFTFDLDGRLQATGGKRPDP